MRTHHRLMQASVRVTALAGALAIMLASVVGPSPAIVHGQPTPPAQRPISVPQTPSQSLMVPAGVTVSLGSVTVVNQSTEQAAQLTLAGDRLAIAVPVGFVIVVEGQTCTVSQTADAFTCTVNAAPGAAITFDVGGTGRGVQRPLPPPQQPAPARAAPPAAAPVPAAAVPPSGTAPLAPPIATGATVATPAPAVVAPAAVPTIGVVAAPSSAPAAAGTPDTPAAPAPAAVGPAATTPAVPAAAVPRAPVAAAPAAPAPPAAPAVLPRSGAGPAAAAGLYPGAVAAAGLLVLALCGAVIVRGACRNQG